MSRSKFPFIEEVDETATLNGSGAVPSRMADSATADVVISAISADARICVG